MTDQFFGGGGDFLLCLSKEPDSLPSTRPFILAHEQSTVPGNEQECVPLSFTEEVFIFIINKLLL